VHNKKLMTGVQTLKTLCLHAVVLLHGKNRLTFFQNSVK